MLDKYGVRGTQNYAKKIHSYLFSTARSHRILVYSIGGIPASDKTTLVHLLTECINLSMSVFLLGTVTENCLRWKQDETAMMLPNRPLTVSDSDVHAIPLHESSIG